MAKYKPPVTSTGADADKLRQMAEEAANALALSLSEIDAAEHPEALSAIDALQTILMGTATSASPDVSATEQEEIGKNVFHLHKLINRMETTGGKSGTPLPPALTQAKAAIEPLVAAVPAPDPTTVPPLPPPPAPPAPKPKSLIPETPEDWQKIGWEAQRRGSDGGSKLAKAADLAQLGARAMAGDPTAMVGLAAEVEKAINERFDAVGKGLEGAGKHGSQFMQTDRLGGSVGHVGGGVEEMAKGLGKFTEGIPGVEQFFKGIEYAGKTLRVFGDTLETFRSWNDSLTQSNLKFAEFSAAMTAVEVSVEKFQIRMSQERGGRRSDAAMRHAESAQRLEAAIAPLEDAFQNFKAELMIVLNDKLTPLISGIHGFLVSRGWIKADSNTNTGNQGLAWEAVNNAVREGWAEDFGLPAGTRRTPKFD